MSVQPTTRATVSHRWIGAAIAAFVLVSGSSLLAQDQKDKEKEKDRKAPAPAHKSAPPPANKGNTPPSNGQPANHPSGGPTTTQSEHSNGTGYRPAGNPPAGNTPAGNPPSNSGGYHPAPSGNSSTPGTYRPANGTPANNDRPHPTPGTSMGRPAVTPGRPAVENGPRPVYHGSNGAEVHYRPNGQPQVVRTHDMTIVHSPSGVARAEYVRPDRSVIVTQGRHYGYVQRPFVVNNVSYVQRTYVVGGVSYARVYRPYVYRGVSLNLYVSSHYYAPAYYGWAYSPWTRPVVFSFGWGARPWFGFYAGYFAPYPTYAGPSYWLTDYMMAQTLQDAYQQQMDAYGSAPPPAYGAVPGGQVALTPDVKQAIADEVHRQLDQEKMESQGGMPAQAAPAFLSDNASHVFVVANGIDVQSGAGDCPLTEGDVLQMAVPPPANSAMASLMVLASKGQDCRKGSTVSVAIPDLMDMQNHMRATLDQGLADLQSRQGQGGLPAAPPAASRPAVDAPFLASAPPPDPNIATEVSQQAESAAQAESDVLSQAQSSSAPTFNGGGTQSVSLGMSIDQVVGIMGQPQVKADLGAKKIYTYGNMKIIFQDGKVADVQ
jgi:hypothetical protein